MKSNSIVSNNNQYNTLKQQENALIQDVAGRAVAHAIGRDDAAGNLSQILGGLRKRQVQKRANAHLDTVVSNGMASGIKMVSGVVSGITRNAAIAFGANSEEYDKLTASPFTPKATWTGAQKVDTSKEGMINRIEEEAFAKFLENNGMDGSLAKTVAGATNSKIKAAKAKKEERINAIESTAQTALAVTAMALTGGAAAPAVGTILTGGASASFYALQAASIATSMAIGSRTGGAQGAAAGFVNGVVNAMAPGMEPKPMAAFSISYDKKNGWGGGLSMGGNQFNGSLSVSQRGGAQVSLGTKYGSINYNAADGTYGANVNVTALLGGSKEAPNKKDANIAPSFFSNALRGLGANVGWNSRTGT